MHTFHERTGLAPDRVKFGAKYADQDLKPAKGGSSFQLRPEFVESLFIFYRITGNGTYQQWGWEMFQAMEAHCSTQIAYRSIVPLTVYHGQSDYLLLVVMSSVDGAVGDKQNAKLVIRRNLQVLVSPL